jgi:NagD protein
MTILNYLIDMDGVLVHGKKIIPGADKFIERLIKAKRKFLVLTNNSLFTPGDLAHRLQNSGLPIEKEQIFTSAMAVAFFLKKQKPGGTAYVIGESGLTEAVHDAGFVLTSTEPDFVVLGETNSYSFEQITKAVRLVAGGARFIATNPDPSGPTEHGIVPATGAMAALIEKASGRSPFYVGKPNPIMMRSAINYLGVHSEDTVMIGDRMDTDIIAGMETGLETYLVLTGITQESDINKFPYLPGKIFASVAEIPVE